MPDKNLNDNPRYQDLLMISDLANNPAWLRENARFIRKTMRRALDDSALFAVIASTIADLLPSLVTDPESGSWFDGVAAAVADHTPAPGSIFQRDFQVVVARFSELAGAYSDADACLPSTLERLVRAYIQLFKVLIYNHAMFLPHDVLGLAEKAAEHVYDRRLKAEFLRVLALYYAHYGSWFYAKRYANKSLSESAEIEYALGCAQAHFTLEIIYRGEQDYVKSEYYFRQAKAEAEKAEGGTLFFATLLYEDGVQCYRYDLFPMALTYFEDALKLFEEHEEVSHHIAMTHTMFALTYTHMQRFDDADAALARARALWAALGNGFELANLTFAEATLEYMRGNFEKAHRLLDDAEAQFRAAPVTDLTESMLNEIAGARQRFSGGHGAVA